MLKIELEMVDAINNGRNWRKGNTSVRHTLDGYHVYLHDNRIARIVGREVVVNIQTLKNWPTATTKSRLRALGVDVITAKGVTLLNGVDITTL